MELELITTLSTIIKNKVSVLKAISANVKRQANESFIKNRRTVKTRI